MIVVDASVAVDLLLAVEPYADRVAQIAGEAGVLHAPYLIDAEVGQVFRRHVLGGALNPNRAERALVRLHEMRLIRYPHLPILDRAFALRRNFSVYDALYVALAEALDAQLLTRDAGIARSARRLVEVIHIS